MRKLKTFSLILLAITIMLFAGSISETQLAVNAQTTNQTHHKRKTAKKAKKKNKKSSNAKHKKSTKKKATKKKKTTKKHTKKNTKSKKKKAKKSKKITKTKHKSTAKNKLKKKVPSHVVKAPDKKTQIVKNNDVVNNKTERSNNIIKDDDNVIFNDITPTTRDSNYYQSADGFNYPSDDHASPNASDTLNIPSGYLFSFDTNSKQVVQGTASSDSITQSRQINRFHPNTTDINTKVDVENINTDLQRQLSQYAANLVNDFRNKLSNNYPYTQELTVTDRALQASKEVADGYNNDNWNFANKGGHDTSVLNNVFNKYNFNAYGENIAGSLLTNSYINGSVTLANVKESIYGAICAMMFDDADSNWGHADNFLGIGFDNSSKQEFGVSIDKMGQIHFEIYQ
ncbi:hypothetical protein AKUH3B110M_00710 [Apilactobacillus kunkeei]|uniref:SEC10/PgrA surface exclusion domain-containing protein n=1 Tax=Apilactobacillus kunkeei TaxID=148814 RepID=UPI00200B48BD|nr:SEC10/PgrA surface exclusion domain-containing protein [Apilactobacillus kunkeei]MCK8634716.1 SEC10/PgrA surface exclusion domain-containing protein [Apilactobacillus kunkeei]CAI2551157.1 hypothetical protein AKUG0405_00720 [Apilactobacillus kunkeei]CAI2551234.1 hypothetical protein AKUG0101_00730 [Apilactobacillus kunkeei]CAI2551247.1 hypothetical protein AKUG0802_00720 [Apilactobacillus kunkeei]CAI2551373.1 hypothetical protein AKUG0103_00720 [Apilactobacillus kunkeei]